MGIHDALERGPGYTLEQRLRDHELRTLQQMISARYLAHLGSLDANLAEEAERLGIANYHLLCGRLDHATAWRKQARVLPVDDIARIEAMGFCQAIAEEYGEYIIYAEDLMWRLVRPGVNDDVGPIHADRWFWDLGMGDIPTGFSRFKIWIPIHAEPGRNGLSVKPYSQLRNDWKYHGEQRHGVTKPVLDENPADLNMELLPLAPGQMVMFHDGLLHGGVINKGTRCRVSLEMTIFFRSDFETARVRRAA